MRKITPHLWFDKEAKEAAELYTSLIPNSKIAKVRTLHDTPSGDCDIVSFELSGQPFMAISAGPLFKFNPSVSFHLKWKTKDEVEAFQGWKSSHASWQLPVQRAVRLAGRQIWTLLADHSHDSERDAWRLE